MTAEEATKLVEFIDNRHTANMVAALLVEEASKAYKHGTEQLTALREYVREQAAIAVPAHEAGGINQVNFRLGMAKAYRDIEKRLTEMEKPK